MTNEVPPSIVSTRPLLAGRILVVCTAGVCRSPAGQFVLEHELAELLQDSDAISSAGLHAQAGAPMCSVSSSALLPREDAERFRRHHHARQLTKESVDRADLVVTMEHEQRARVNLLSPGSQAKVFTLTELSHLAGLAAEAGSTTGYHDVAGIAAELHAYRGMAPVVVVDQRRRLGKRHQPSDPLTIPDGHSLARREHLAAVERVSAAALRAGNSIRRLAQDRGVPASAVLPPQLF